MINYKQVQEMLDQQLNESIAVLLGEHTEPPIGSDVELYGNKKGYSSFSDAVLFDCHADYVDDWNLLMPLVIDSCISYADRNDGRKGRFLAQHSFQNDRKPPYHEGNSNWTYIESVNDNLQRALAECVLMVISSKR